MLVDQECHAVIGFELTQYLANRALTIDDGVARARADLLQYRVQMRVVQRTRKDGNRLHTTSDATTVRVRDGETITSDGPFAETKEQIGGYYLVDCKDLDEAIEIASKIPGAATGSVEVRPIWEM